MTVTTEYRFELPPHVYGVPDLLETHIRHPFELGEVPEDAADQEVFVLGADDLEMQEMIDVLVAERKHFIIACDDDGKRVQPPLESAYQAPLDDRLLRFGKVVFVECDLRPEDKQQLDPDKVMHIDHHHILGDLITPDDNRPENWRAASLAQLMEYLGLEPTEKQVGVCQSDQDFRAGYLGLSEASIRSVLRAKKEGIAALPGMDRLAVEQLIGLMQGKIAIAQLMQPSDLPWVDLRGEYMGRTWYNPLFLSTQVAAAAGKHAVVHHRHPGSDETLAVLVGWAEKPVIKTFQEWTAAAGYAMKFCEPERGIAIATTKPTVVAAA